MSTEEVFLKITDAASGCLEVARIERDEFIKSNDCLTDEELESVKNLKDDEIILIGLSNIELAQSR